jgi:hypothetical protein
MQVQPFNSRAQVLEVPRLEQGRAETSPPTNIYRECAAKAARFEIGMNSRSPYPV